MDIVGRSFMLITSGVKGLKVSDRCTKLVSKKGKKVWMVI